MSHGLSKVVVIFTGDEPVRESFPAETHWSVHTDEKEKGPQKEPVESDTVRDICCHPAFLPSFRRKIQEGIGGVEHEFGPHVPAFPDIGSLESQLVVWFVGDAMRSFTGQAQKAKPLMLNQIFGDSMFARANTLMAEISPRSPRSLCDVGEMAVLLTYLHINR